MPEGPVCLRARCKRKLDLTEHQLCPVHCCPTPGCAESKSNVASVCETHTTQASEALPKGWASGVCDDGVTVCGATSPSPTPALYAHPHPHQSCSCWPTLVLGFTLPCDRHLTVCPTEIPRTVPLDPIEPFNASQHHSTLYNRSVGILQPEVADGAVQSPRTEAGQRIAPHKQGASSQAEEGIPRPVCVSVTFTKAGQQPTHTDECHRVRISSQTRISDTFMGAHHYMDPPYARAADTHSHVNILHTSAHATNYGYTS